MATQQSQNAHHGLRDSEVQLPQEAETNQRRQHRHQDVDAVADDDVAHAGIGVVVLGKDGKARDIGADHIRRQQEQRLADAIPALQLSPAAVHAEFGKFVGKHLRFGSPQGVGGLQAMGGVGGAQLTGLHHEGDETGGQGQQEKRVTKPASKIQYSHYDLMRLLPGEIGWPPEGDHAKAGWARGGQPCSGPGSIRNQARFWDLPVRRLCLRCESCGFGRLHVVLFRESHIRW